MERRVWTHPLTQVQKFEANEYVAACGDSGTTYLFTLANNTLGYKYYKGEEE